jgi:hypothetical protein
MPANLSLRGSKALRLTYFTGQAFAHIDKEMRRCNYRDPRMFRRE